MLVEKTGYVVTSEGFDGIAGKTLFEIIRYIEEMYDLKYLDEITYFREHLLMFKDEQDLTEFNVSSVLILEKDE